MRDLILHLARGVQDQVEFHERIRTDPVLAERLAFANEHGIPPSVLTGRVHPNPLDPTEPLWLPEDWSDVLSYRFWLRGVCPHCGLHERDWGSDTDQPYIARARLCHGCAEVLDAQEEFQDHGHARALRLTLVPHNPDEVVG